MVSLGTETGTMTASLWCKDHIPTKTFVHRIGEEVKGDVSSPGETFSYLQHFVQTCKQADLTLTGTMRKANLMTMAAKTSGAATQVTARRGSITTPTSATAPNGAHYFNRNAEATEATADEEHRSAKVCISCGVDVSLRWWPIDNAQERELTNGHYGMIGSEAQKFVEQRRFQCHKCRKTHRSPVAHQPWPSSNAVLEAPRPPLSEPGLQPPQPPALRSPGSGYPDNRDVRASYHGWAQHHPIHTGPQPVHTPHHSQSHITTSRPGPLSQAYPTTPHSLPPATVSGPPPIQAPARSSFGNDWGPRPSSQHGTPPRHLNGGPPSLTNGPPLGNLSSLRPPSMSGPGPGTMPPSGPVGHSHGHGPAVHGHSHSHSHGHNHTAPSYMKGLPPSPRRGSGPAPPSPFAAPYQPAPAQVHAPPPPPLPPVSHHAPHHGLSNGPPPPPPRADPFCDPFPHGMPPQRPQYPAQSPSGSGQVLPPTHDPRHPAPFPPRNGADGRPATGASASPSLRNLLS